MTYLHSWHLCSPLYSHKLKINHFQDNLKNKFSFHFLKIFFKMKINLRIMICFINILLTFLTGKTIAGKINSNWTSIPLSHILRCFRIKIDFFKSLHLRSLTCNYYSIRAAFVRNNLCKNKLRKLIFF